MPTYNTPEPIDLAIDLKVGDVEIVATDRADTVVTVSPRSATQAVDRRGAEDTKITFDGQRLSIVGPRPRLSWIGPGPFDTVDIKVELPMGSRFTAEVAVGRVRTVGRLGATRIKSSTGPVDIDTTGDLWVYASNVTVGSAEGGIEITSEHGQLRVGAVTGDAILKGSYGSILIGESGGDVDAKLSYGDLEMTKARGSVTAKTAYGRIRLHEVCCGSIQAKSGYGEISIGVRPGVPAWLDLSSKNGHVRNELTGDAAPDPSDQTVEIRASTGWGDISIQRAQQTVRSSAEKGTEPK
jgi:hypothetical protein